MTENLQPYPQKLSFFERVQLYLFDDPTQVPAWHAFTEHELKVKKRYASIFSFWIDKPVLSDKQITNYIVSELGISKTQAWRDIQQVKILLGNVRNATKEWQRYKVISMLDRAYEFAEKKRDAKSMILAANTLGKYTQLDKEEAVPLPYDEIVPQNWEITGDVSVLGLKPIKNLAEKQKQLREKYGGMLVEEADVIDEDE